MTAVIHSKSERMRECAEPVFAQSADISGIRALLVHAKNEPARQWYLHWELEPSPSDPFHLFLLMKGIKAMTGK